MTTHEENPFTDPDIADAWINSVENERGLTRDHLIYPYLRRWAAPLASSATILEIGAGQGICAEKIESPATYIGIEPSEPLVQRALERYAAPNRHFIVGDAYKMPILSASIDAAFSVNVWFHLQDLTRASQELSRVLKRSGEFLIITADPDAYDLWESFFETSEKEGKRIVGKINIPVNPLAKNVFYQHTLQEMTTALTAAGLTTTSIDKLAIPPEVTALTDVLFIAIRGHSHNRA